MGTNNILFRLGMDSSQFLSEFERVVKSTEVKTRQGLDVVLKTHLDQSSYNKTMSMLDKLQNASYQVGGKKYTINSYAPNDLLEHYYRLEKAHRGKKSSPIFGDLRVALDGIIDAGNRANGTVVRTGRTARESFDAMTKSLRAQQGIFGKLNNLAGRYFNIFMASRFVKNIAEMTGYFERQQVALEGIIGSASKAQSVMNGVKSMALKSPFTTQKIIQDVKQLAAYGIEPENLLPDTKMLGDLSAGLGVEMDRLILAYGQVKTAAVLRGQELRQFTEAGVPMVQKLADKFTELNGKLVTTGEVFGLISKRQVSFEMVADVLRDMTAEGGAFYNMQENVTNTAYGQIQKLKDMWTLGLNNVGSGGFANGAIMGGVKALQFALKNMTLVVTTFITTTLGTMVVRLVATWQKATKEATTFAAKFIALKKNVAASTTLWNGAALAIGLFVGAIANAAAKALEWRRTLSDIRRNHDKDLTSMTVGFDKLIGKIRTFNVASKQYQDAISAMAQNYGEFVDIEKIKELKAQGDAVGGVAAEWGKLTAQVREAITAQNEYNRLKDLKETGANTAIDNYTQKALINIARLDDKLVDRKGGKYNLQGQGAFAYTKLGEEIIGSSVVSAVQSALRIFQENNYTTASELEPILERQLTIFGVSKEGITAITSHTKDILDYLKKQKEWKEYEKDANAINNTPEEKMDRRFRASSEAIESRGYKYAKKDVSYMYAAVKSLEDLGLNSDANKLRALMDNSKKNWSSGDTTTFANAIDEMAKKNPANRYIYSRLKNIFLNTAGTRSGAAKQVTDKLINMSGTLDEDKLKFFNRFIPTDQTYESMIESIQSGHKAAEDIILRYTNPTGETLELVNDQKKITGYYEELARIYQINPNKKTTGSGRSSGQSGGYRSLFSDIFKLIKEAKSEQEKLIGVTGVGATLLSAINAENGSDLLKDFYGGNPFQSFINNLEKYGVSAEGVFNAADFEGLKSVFKKVNGVDVVDYSAVWDQVVGILDKKIGDLTGDKNKSTRSALEAAKADAIQQKIAMEGKSKTNEQIEEAIQELTRIADNTESQKGRFDIYERLKNVVGYDAAAQIMGQGGAGVRFDGVGNYSRALRRMLDTDNVGMKDKLPELDALLDGSRLNIDNVVQLIDIMEQLSEIGAIAGVDGAELEKVKDKFSKTLQQLIDALVSDEERMKDVMTDSQKTGIANSNAYDKHIQNMNYLSALLAADKIKEPEYKKLVLEEQKRYYNEKAKNFGGTGTFGFVGEGNNMSVSLQNFLAGLTGQANLKEMVANYAAANGGIDMQKFADDLEKADTAITATIKAVDAMTDILGQMIKMLRATNDIIAYDVDNAGNLTATNRYNENRLNQAENAINIIKTFSGHISEGWNALKNGDFIGAGLAIFNSISDLVTQIAEATDGTIEYQQKLNTKLVEAKNHWIELYQWQQSYTAGAEKWNEVQKEINARIEQNAALQENIDLETTKKNGDGEKMQDWQDQITSNNRAIIDSIRSIREEILGTADSLASNLGDALVNAFRNGENAARAWRDAVKSYIGDAIKTMMIEKLLAPQLETILDKWAYGFNDIYRKDGSILTAEDQFREAGKDYNDMLDNMKKEGNVRDAYQSMIALGTSMENFIENMSPGMRDFLTYSSGKSSLSGGVQSITEETAGRLEAIANSQLGEVFLIRRAVEEIGASNNTQIATIQGHLVSINSNIIAFRSAFESVMDNGGAHRVRVVMD